jgi:hypothetical protein
MRHPTQIFLSNPQALRVEFEIDRARLILWWSPKAGTSYNVADRNYSSRDAHLEVFEEIHFPGCDLEHFERCDYAPYHTVLHYSHTRLHLAPAADLPMLMVWTESVQDVIIKGQRHDPARKSSASLFLLEHREPRYTFEFAAGLQSGNGPWRYAPFREPENPMYTRATLLPGKLLGLGVGLDGENISSLMRERLEDGPAAHLDHTETILAPHLASGRIASTAHPELVALRADILRGLHAMIDESGAFRASLKAIYYLLWIRDSSFSFAYQSAAGWPHKIESLVRLLLENPTTLESSESPPQRVFAQLISRRYGKLEEDGIFYVVWALFTQWTQLGHLEGITEKDWHLLDEALEWMESMTWDAERGLYGEHFADEEPTLGARDYGWDFAIGLPLDGSEALSWNGQRIVRNYDIYFNTLMHSTYTMLAALRKDRPYLERAQRVWPELEKLHNQRQDGLPVYAEQLTEKGDRVVVPAWGQVSSCCVWGLTIPHFLPLTDGEEIHAAVMDGIIAAPKMHWINGICAAMAAVDPWFYPESKLLALHQRIEAETRHPGKFLPMGGAMPEKFDAPEGNLYHDIRPQGFAMGTWLAAWSSLGLRRLPYGLALRPTEAFEQIENYPWRGTLIDFQFGCKPSRNLGLEIDGEVICGTLQVPMDKVAEKQRAAIKLVDSGVPVIWLKSSVELQSVTQTEEDGFNFTFLANGLASITLDYTPRSCAIVTKDGSFLESREESQTRCHKIFFTHFGEARLRVRL